MHVLVHDELGRLMLRRLRRGTWYSPAPARPGSTVNSPLA
jgi:hypothetical protein